MELSAGPNDTATIQMIVRSAVDCFDDTLSPSGGEGWGEGKYNRCVHYLVRMIDYSSPHPIPLPLRGRGDPSFVSLSPSQGSKGPFVRRSRLIRRPRCSSLSPTGGEGRGAGKNNRCVHLQPTQARTNAHTNTVSTPALRRHRATSATVAPLVMTSSTIATLAGMVVPVVVNTRRRLRRRAAGGRPTWGRVYAVYQVHCNRNPQDA